MRAYLILLILTFCIRMHVFTHYVAFYLTNVSQSSKTPSLLLPDQPPPKNTCDSPHVSKTLRDKNLLCIHTNTGVYWIVKRIDNELQQQQQVIL